MKEETLRVVEVESVPLIKNVDLNVRRLVQEGTVVKLSKSTSEPGWTCTAVYDYTEYVYVLRGELTLTCEDKKEVAKAGGLICIEPKGKLGIIRWENTGKEPSEQISIVEPHGADVIQAGMTTEKFKEIAKTIMIVAVNAYQYRVAKSA